MVDATPVPDHLKKSVAMGYYGVLITDHDLVPRTH